MNKLRLLLLIPLIVFFVSILIVFFSPIKLLPCETSQTDPATSWESTKCKGYYLVVNPSDGQKINVNNSGFLINLIILVCGSFLFNGILFLVLFIIVSLNSKSRKEIELAKWEEVAALDDEPKKKLFSNPFKKKKSVEVPPESSGNEFNI